MMTQRPGLQELLAYLRTQCARGISSSVYFFGRDATWGKIDIRQGDIQSLRCCSTRGPKALPLLSGAGELKFHALDEPEGSHHALEQNIDTETFFDFFNDLEVDTASGPVVEPGLKRGDGQRVILVVDDSQIVRRALARELIRTGYRVIEAKDGFEALAQLSNDPPNLVLLDLTMPGIDGYKVLEAVRANQRHRDLPVFIFTARNGLLDRVKGRMSAADEYLTKPVDPALLLERIATYLG